MKKDVKRTLSWSDLEGIAAKESLTAYLCCDDFETVKKDVKEDYPGITTINHKTEVMWRLLEDKLNYGKLEEFDGETEDEELHSYRMELRCSLLDKVAEAWVYGEINSLIKAQEYLNKLLEKIDEERLFC